MPAVKGRSEFFEYDQRGNTGLTEERPESENKWKIMGT